MNRCSFSTYTLYMCKSENNNFWLNWHSKIKIFRRRHKNWISKDTAKVYTHKNMPHRTIVLVQGFNSYPHTWNLGLCNTICSEPCCLLASCFCFPCANYSIRKTALNRDLSNYRCFQGYYCGILACCCPCQAECGSCCLLGESLLCPHVSVMSTRHLVQEKYNV